MRFIMRGVTVLIFSLVTAAVPRLVAAQTMPPLPVEGGPPNIYFGEIPPAGVASPVLVFVHGLNGIAQDWWAPPNDMYTLAFNAGYRTAFVSLSADLTRNNEGIIPNANELRMALGQIVMRLNAQQVYIVAHSKGGVDTQAALLDPSLSFYVKGVFTIATPHLGSEFADLINATAPTTITPALNALRTDNMLLFRAVTDPLATLAGVPYFTMSASAFNTPPHEVTSASGLLLAQLPGGLPNDGIATPLRSRLPPNYSRHLGDIASNHFVASHGSLAFPRIHAQIQAMEAVSPFRRIATNGFSSDEFGNPLSGDRQNSFPWSTQWFKGKLYVGTGRSFLCVVQATADLSTYPPLMPDVECTPDATDLPLAAEIWRYTPETHTWERVFQSTYDVPIVFDENGAPTKFTARDIAFRGMAVFRENGTGTERLYIGAISPASVYEQLPQFSDPSVRRLPPPRMLWTEDGTTWNVVPQTPGTFFGDLNIQTEVVNKRGFRSFVSLPDAQGVNRLFVTVSDLRGVGRVIVSSNPSAGDNAWRQVSPNATDLPIFTIYPYRNQIYATVGDTGFPGGYAVYKSDVSTPDAQDPTRFAWVPVIVGENTQLMRALSAISMQEFNGDLYIGTDRPTELIRIHPDDTWDLLVGATRATTSGLKQALTGLDKGFNSLFNGHFYSMAVHNGELFLGTWDWSQMLRGTDLDGLFEYQYGFDLFKTRDGVHWNLISRTGLGDGLNSSVRNLESTPFGLFAAVTNPYFGLQMFVSQTSLDLNRDGIISYPDVQLVLGATGQPASGPTDARDLDRDGMITVEDAAKLASQCTQALCGRVPLQPLRLRVSPSAPGPGPQ